MPNCYRALKRCTFIIFLAGCFLSSSIAGRAASPLISDLTGIWEFSALGSDSKCRIALRSSSATEGHQMLTIPLACLRLFPGLAPVQSWVLTDEGHILFIDRTDKAVLDFASVGPNAFSAGGATGETYNLIGELRHPPPSNVAVAQNRVAGQAPEADTSKPASSVAVMDPAGHYSVLREGDRDSGCMLTLDDQHKGSGPKKAFLAPGCRDQGIIIFDPIGWQILNGRLILTARKGHKAELNLQPDGSWKKDPRDGKALTLKKL